LWGCGHEGMKIAWVGWPKVCNAVEVGGLGIKNIRKFNEALLAKWKWRLGTEEVRVWKEILESRYGSWRDMNTSRTVRQISNWWVNLCKVCDAENHSNWFDNNVDERLRMGKRLGFGRING